MQVSLEKVDNVIIWWQLYSWIQRKKSTIISTIFAVMTFQYKVVDKPLFYFSFGHLMTKDRHRKKFHWFMEYTSGWHIWPNLIKIWNKNDKQAEWFFFQFKDYFTFFSIQKIWKIYMFNDNKILIIIIIEILSFHIFCCCWWFINFSNLGLLYLYLSRENIQPYFNDNDYWRQQHLSI